jgi:hypothetical protein
MYFTQLPKDMKDLEPILDVLCNYQAGFVLNTEEVAILSEWLKESELHRKLLKDLGDWTRIYMGNVGGDPRGNILRRLLEMDEPD